MSLHLSPNTKSMIRLDKKTWSDDAANLAAAKRTKKEADAAARGADSVIKALTSKFLAAMDGASSAVVGETVLTVKPGTDTPAALTLADGRKIPWANVVGVVVGNTTIPAAEVKTLFGGRSTGDSIDVTGA